MPTQSDKERCVGLLKEVREILTDGPSFPRDPASPIEKAPDPIQFERLARYGVRMAETILRDAPSLVVQGEIKNMRSQLSIVEGILCGSKDGSKKGCL